MKLKWEHSNKNDNFHYADCGPITLDVELSLGGEDAEGGWFFWVDETGEEDGQSYETMEDAMEAAEKYAETKAREILAELGL